jgi:hypothetical protein
MAENSSMTRRARTLAAIFLMLCFSASSYSLGISIASGGNWAPDLSTYQPTLAGANFSPTSIDSPTGQLVLSIAGGGSNNGWHVDVSRTTTAWDTAACGLSLQMLATHTEPTVTGWSTFTAITGSAQTCFSTTAKNKSDTATLTYRIAGLTVLMGMSNTTTVTYTITKY